MWIDGHLDLAYLAELGRDLSKPCDDPNDCVSLPSLRAARVDVVFGTIFTEPGVTDESQTFGYRDADDIEGASRAGRRQLDVYRRLEDEGEITIVRTRADLDRGPTPRVVLLMEGADPIKNAEEVAWWAEAGVKLVGLTWSTGTRYAGGNATHDGLSAAGRDVVAALDDAGIVHDLSHLSDKAFDDVMTHATGRVVATHSNCRAIAGDDPRHLEDHQVRAIGERGGIVGLNLYRRFIGRGEVTASDAIDHVERVAQLMGRRDAVALGSDLDGGFGRDGLPVDVQGPEAFEVLAAELGARGWSDVEVEGFRCGNWWRVLGEVLG